MGYCLKFSQLSSLFEGKGKGLPVTCHEDTQTRSSGIVLSLIVGATLERTVVTLRRLYPLGKSLSMHCTGGWVGQYEWAWRRINLLTPSGFEPQTVQPVASLYLFNTITYLDIWSRTFKILLGKNRFLCEA